MESVAVPAAPEAPALPWRIVRIFDGTRTAEQVVSDIIKVHVAS